MNRIIRLAFGIPSVLFLALGVVGSLATGNPMVLIGIAVAVSCCWLMLGIMLIACHLVDRSVAHR